MLFLCTINNFLFISSLAWHSIDTYTASRDGNAFFDIDIFGKERGKVFFVEFGPLMSSRILYFSQNLYMYSSSYTQILQVNGWLRTKYREVE